MTPNHIVVVRACRGGVAVGGSASREPEEAPPIGVREQCPKTTRHASRHAPIDSENLLRPARHASHMRVDIGGNQHQYGQIDPRDLRVCPDLPASRPQNGHRASDVTQSHRRWHPRAARPAARRRPQRRTPARRAARRSLTRTVAVAVSTARRHDTRAVPAARQTGAALSGPTGTALLVRSLSGRVGGCPAMIDRVGWAA